MRLITGATGCVGDAVLRRLLHEGFPPERIAAVVRRPRTQPPGSRSRIRWIQGDLAKAPFLLPDDLPPVTACIHAAALVHAPDADLDEFQEVNVEGTLRLAEAVSRHGVGARFIFLSTLPMANDSTRATPYARSKLQAEQALLERAGPLGLEVVILRLATVYGPGDRGNMAVLARSIARGVYRRTAPAGTLKTLLSAERAARAVSAALDPSVPSGSIALVADPEPLRLDRIEDAFAEAKNRPPPPRVPAPIATLLAAVGSCVGVIPGVRPPLDLRRLRTLSRPVAHLPEGPEPILSALAKDTVSFEERIQQHYGKAHVPTAPNHAIR